MRTVGPQTNIFLHLIPDYWLKACENLRIELKLDWEKWGCSAGINAKSVAFQGAESAASGKIML